jgi:hypothetical protein
MRDILASATMFTGFACFMAAVGSCLLLVTTGFVFPMIDFVASVG